MKLDLLPKFSAILDKAGLEHPSKDKRMCHKIYKPIFKTHQMSRMTKKQQKSTDKKTTGNS